MAKLTDQNRETEPDRIIQIWKQVMQYMREFSSEKLFFEMYNEPVTSAETWKQTANTIVKALRRRIMTGYLL